MYGIVIGGVCVLIAAVLAGTGWWRAIFGLFAIPARKMTVQKLGLGVSAPANVERINRLLQSFTGGFNAMITAPTQTAATAHCAALPALYRPFAEEGLAMGYTPRNLFRCVPGDFEETIVKSRPEYRYLYYVGLGFWSGMRRHEARHLAAIVEELDPLHGSLCYDGYGFKHGFFDYPKNPESLRRLDAFDETARHVAYQGVGRAFYFLFMDDPGQLVEHITKLDEYAADAAAGVGLASVFINPDRLEVARACAKEMPEPLQESFHLGMCFGLKARSINDVDQFQRDLSTQDASVREAVFASVRECDRIELQVRSEKKDEGYRVWRSRVADWMARHIEYPLNGVVSSATNTLAETSGMTR